MTETIVQDAPNIVEEVLSQHHEPPTLEESLNKVALPAYFAQQLLKSLDRWKNTDFEDSATASAQEVLPQFQPGMSVYAWQFLLDFYLGGQRPFRGLPKRQR